MQRPQFQQHDQVRIQGDTAEPRNVVHVGTLVDPRAFHPFRDQHTARGHLVKDLGSTDGLQIPLFHFLIESIGMCGFGAVIEFGNEPPAPFVDQDLKVCRRLGEFLVEGCPFTAQVQVERNFGQDIGALDLDGYKSFSVIFVNKRCLVDC